MLEVHTSSYHVITKFVPGFGAAQNLHHLLSRTEVQSTEAPKQPSSTQFEASNGV